MHCEQVQVWLGRFHDGELDPAQRALIEDHVGGCPGCAGELAALVEVGETARALPQPEPPASLWAQIESRLRARRGLRWRTAAVAALVLIALATSWIAYRNSGFVPSESDRDPSLESLLAARMGQPLTLQEAARRVAFRVEPTPELRDGYCLEECCLCKAGRCDVVRCKFLRGGDQVWLLLCSPDHPVDSGNRPCLYTQVNGKCVRLVQCEAGLAAQWQTKDTAFCLIGPRDLAHLVRLVASVDQCPEGSK